MYVLGYTGFTRDSRSAIGVRSPFAKTDQDFDTIFEFRDGEVPFSMFPLGFFGHDASAALVKDGGIVACASEERFIRVKHALNLAGNTLLPKHAIAYCLNAAGITISDVDVVAHYCDFSPVDVQQRYESLRPFLTDHEGEAVEKSFAGVYKTMLSREVVEEQFRRMTGAVPRSFVPVRHHRAHAASAFYPSGFEEALILTIDGTGEVESSLLAVGSKAGIHELATRYIPTSLGTLYLLLTVYLGFRSLGDEYKVMGLASYGDPARFRELFAQLVPIDEGGIYHTPLLASRDLKQIILSRLGRARKKDDPIEPRHADVAASLQEALNDAVLATLRRAREETGIPKLCLAGGVALNCTMNGVIARSGLFDGIFAQPAGSDEGCSAGAALYIYADHQNGRPSSIEAWNHVYFGPNYAESDIVIALEAASERIVWKKPDDPIGYVAAKLAEGNVLGWFQGRMEFGPRALGNRSILADPRRAEMKDRINKKVKNREPFRPFAPAVPDEVAAEFFDLTGLQSSPFMLFTVPVRDDKRDQIPAVTHVDGTARVQTVSKGTNARFWNLLQEFKRITGIPVLLNTSYNVMNEPIVCTPRDAIACFLSTDMDATVLGDFYVEKRTPA
jgi:carbamoyltransferase